METPIDRVEEILIAALDQPSEHARRTFLDSACGNTSSLRKQVDQLIENHLLAGDFLRTPLTNKCPTAVEMPGDLIDRYKLLEVIGEGGFGLVFLAEQQQPVQRTVALKVLKPGMDTSQIVRRFEIERQALALMEHPGIARVFDGGITSTGRPYFVMELVNGVPITKYCDDNRLANLERLALFVAVCQAVQHAHQKGIIHRDLKPANILVSEVDGQPVTKVIDFGIAKALGKSLGNLTLVTNAGAITGTLEYMSPEQAKLGDADVDTRSDIYSLGVLLYELLTGTAPITSERLKNVTLPEALRLICEAEVPPPSLRLRESSEALERISKLRKREPGRLVKEVRGELDWITQKCLEKERGRRYATVNALARDVNCFLNDEPVEACPPSRWYKVSKFSKRHWPAMAAASAFLLLLVISLTGLSFAYIRVNQEREQKELALKSEGERRQQTRAALDAMSSQIIEDWLSKQTTILPEHKSFLEQALQHYKEFAADTEQDHESRAAAAHAFLRVGVIHNLLGQRKEAEAALSLSQDMYSALLIDFPGQPDYRQELAKVLSGLAAIYLQTGRMQESKAARDQHVEIYRGLVTDFPKITDYRHKLAGAIGRQGLLLKNTGESAAAERAFRTAIDSQRQLVLDFPKDGSYLDELAQMYISYGNLLMDLDREADAEEILREAIAAFKKLVSAYPTETNYRAAHANSLNSLGNLLRDAERFDDSEQTYSEALTIRKGLAGDFPSIPEHARSLAQTLNNIGILYKNTDRLPEAENVYRQAFVIHRKLATDFPTVADYQNELGGVMTNLARLILSRNDPQAAMQLLVEAEPFHKFALAANPQNFTYRVFYRLNRWRLAEANLSLLEHASAAAAAQQFLDAATEPPRDSYTAATLFAQCAVLAEQENQQDSKESRQLAAAYVDRAVAALRQAIELKAREVAEINTDHALDPLRSHRDFQSLLDLVDVER